MAGKFRSTEGGLLRGAKARRILAIPADEAAQKLLGCLLVRKLDDGIRLTGRIVETEAYMGVDDLASHAKGGRRTPRTETMYAEAGTAYVYFTYGMHHCMNVVCSIKDDPQAVLIRAVEPVEGIDRMRVHREGGKSLKRPLCDRDLCSGPGKLCEAMAIDRSLDGQDLTRPETLWLIEGAVEGRVVAAARVGIGDCGEWTEKRLRWYLADNPHVSKRAADAEAV